MEITKCSSDPGKPAQQALTSHTVFSFAAFALGRDDG